MNTIPLVRASAALPFVKFLDQIGAPTQRLLKKARVPIPALDNLETLIPLYQWFDSMEQSARSEGSENLGIVVSQQTQIAQVGVLEQLIHQSPTLYSALCTIINLDDAYNSGEQMWLREEGDRQVWLRLHYTCPDYIENGQAQYYALLLCLKGIQLDMAPAWQLEEIHLQSTPDFVGSLQQMLRSLLHDGYPNVALAAEAAGMSIRSFQRRLAESNLNYSLLVEQVRFDEAVRLLQDSTLKLIDIAFELGYTDAANFSRAFRRWTGISPYKFRLLHLKIKVSSYWIT